MKYVLALLVLLHSTPAHALQCLSRDSALYVYYLNGYIPDISADTNLGKMEIFVQPSTGNFIETITDKNGLTCEILKGRKYRVAEDKNA